MIEKKYRVILSVKEGGDWAYLSSSFLPFLVMDIRHRLCEVGLPEIRFVA